VRVELGQLQVYCAVRKKLLPLHTLYMMRNRLAQYTVHYAVKLQAALWLLAAVTIIINGVILILYYYIQADPVERGWMDGVCRCAVQ